MYADILKLLALPTIQGTSISEMFAGTLNKKIYTYIYWEGGRLFVGGQDFLDEKENGKLFLGSRRGEAEFFGSRRGGGS